MLNFDQMRSNITSLIAMHSPADALKQLNKAEHHSDQVAATWYNKLSRAILIRESKEVVSVLSHSMLRGTTELAARPKQKLSTQEQSDIIVQKWLENRNLEQISLTDLLLLKFEEFDIETLCAVTPFAACHFLTTAQAKISFLRQKQITPTQVTLLYAFS